MGMAASQVRFLQLTDRKHDIGRELQHLSLEKMSLTRDMQAVTKEYQSALCSKTMKWSNNSGVSYTDLSYSTLMKPNSYNMKSPILITDSSGRVVLNKQYQKYAEMLDAAGGKWEGDIRNQILSQLTGIPQETIENMALTSSAVAEATNAYNDSLESYDSWKAKETRKAGTEYLTIDKLAKKLGTVNGTDLSELYIKGENGGYHISSVNDLKVLAEGIKNNMSKYFFDDDQYLNIKDKTAFEAGCQAFVDYYTALINDTSETSDSLRESSGLKGDRGDWSLDIKQAFASIMGGYLIYGSYDYSDVSDEKTYPVRYMDTAAWDSWYTELKSKSSQIDSSKAGYDASVDTANQVTTADKESLIRYYDLLFQAIADNGWTSDTQIEDSEYLNQVFQNNKYCVTTITENQCFNEGLPEGSNNTKFFYDTNIASNFDNIFMVNDSDIRNEALVKYEYDKSVINAKESRIDTRMKNLETEQSAITKMLESIDQVKNDNIERTFGIWG